MIVYNERAKQTYNSGLAGTLRGPGHQRLLAITLCEATSYEQRTTDTEQMQELMFRPHAILITLNQYRRPYGERLRLITGLGREAR